MAQPSELGFRVPDGPVDMEKFPWQKFFQTMAGKFWAAAPVAANSPGIASQIAYDAGFLYICVAQNTWKRVAIAAW